LGLFGRDPSFYNLLESLAESAVKAAECFHALTCDFSRRDEHVGQIVRIEKEADETTHELARRTDRTFITPLDKEDLIALAGVLDDITDAIEAAVGRLVLYRLTIPRPDIEPMVASLVQITRLTRQAVAALPRLQDKAALQKLFIAIHHVENDSDRAYRQALQDLFDNPGPDPLMVVKWKEIYDRIEIAVDKCEDVANVVESVVAKYA
jgi:predicted phosphate transport protein (TIGR00153 family)